VKKLNIMKKLLLSILSIISLNVFAQPDVKFNITSDWGTGYCANINITPDQGYDDWEMVIKAPGGINSLWGANSVPIGGGEYKITPSPWKIPIATPFEIGFCGGGSSSDIEIISQSFTPTVTEVISEEIWIGENSSAYLNTGKEYYMVGINKDEPEASLHVGTNTSATSTSIVIETEGSDNAEINFQSGTGVSELNFQNGDLSDISSLTFSKNDNGATMSFYDKINSEEVIKVVDGSLYSREVVVQTDAFPDYVFSSDYNLASLSEVEASIDSLGHLPGVPAAEQVEEEGMSLSQITTIQMEKIEELTLYLIQQQKEIEALKKELNNLKK
tara:strand:- start:456 stop:1445 length:990 start_codon:yes stop_codon:yes gene_type:complete